VTNAWIGVRNISLFGVDTKVSDRGSHYEMAGAGFFVDQYNLTEEELTVSGMLSPYLTKRVLDFCVAESLKIHWKD